MRSIPLNPRSNGWELSELCLIFVLAKNEHCQLTARLDGLIDISFLGTRAGAQLVRGLPCISLAFGGCTGELGPRPSMHTN